MTEHKYKIIIVGDSQVGKTNIMTRYVNNTFSYNTQSTFGHEYAKKLIKIDLDDVNLAIWDTAGQERFRSIAAPYYRDSKGALLVYGMRYTNMSHSLDVTNRTSFESLERWLKDVFQIETIPIVIVGNKIDLDQRAVSTKEGQEFAKKHSLIFSETSACDGTNIEETFEELIKVMMKTEKNVSMKVEDENKLFVQQINAKSSQSNEGGCSC